MKIKSRILAQSLLLLSLLAGVACHRSEDSSNLQSLRIPDRVKADPIYADLVTQLEALSKLPNVSRFVVQNRLQPVIQSLDSVVSDLVLQEKISRTFVENNLNNLLRGLRNGPSPFHALQDRDVKPLEFQLELLDGNNYSAFTETMQKALEIYAAGGSENLALLTPQGAFWVTTDGQALARKLRDELVTSFRDPLISEKFAKEYFLAGLEHILVLQKLSFIESVAQDKLDTFRSTLQKSSASLCTKTMPNGTVVKQQVPLTCTAAQTADGKLSYLAFTDAYQQISNRLKGLKAIDFRRLYAVLQLSALDQTAVAQLSRWDFELSQPEVMNMSWGHNLSDLRKLIGNFRQNIEGQILRAEFVDASGNRYLDTLLDRSMQSIKNADDVMTQRNQAIEADNRRKLSCIEADAFKKNFDIVTGKISTLPSQQDLEQQQLAAQIDRANDAKSQIEKEKEQFTEAQIVDQIRFESESQDLAEKLKTTELDYDIAKKRIERDSATLEFNKQKIADEIKSIDEQLRIILINTANSNDPETKKVRSDAQVLSDLMKSIAASSEGDEADIQKMKAMIDSLFQVESGQFKIGEATSSLETPDFITKKEDLCAAPGSSLIRIRFCQSVSHFSELNEVRLLLPKMEDYQKSGYTTSDPSTDFCKKTLFLETSRQFCEDAKAESLLAALTTNTTGLKDRICSKGSAIGEYSRFQEVQTFCNSMEKINQAQLVKNSNFAKCSAENQIEDPEYCKLVDDRDALLALQNTMPKKEHWGAWTGGRSEETYFLDHRVQKNFNGIVTPLRLSTIQHCKANPNSDTKNVVGSICTKLLKTVEQVPRLVKEKCNLDIDSQVTPFKQPADGESYIIVKFFNLSNSPTFRDCGYVGDGRGLVDDTLGGIGNQLNTYKAKADELINQTNGENFYTDLLNSLRSRLIAAKTVQQSRASSIGNELRASAMELRDYVLSLVISNKETTLSANIQLQQFLLSNKLQTLGLTAQRESLTNSLKEIEKSVEYNTQDTQAAEAAYQRGTELIAAQKKLFDNLRIAQTGGALSDGRILKGEYSYRQNSLDQKAKEAEAGQKIAQNSLTVFELTKGQALRELQAQKSELSQRQQYWSQLCSEGSDFEANPEELGVLADSDINTSVQYLKNFMRGFKQVLTMRSLDSADVAQAIDTWSAGLDQLNGIASRYQRIQQINRIVNGGFEQEPLGMRDYWRRYSAQLYGTPGRASESLLYLNPMQLDGYFAANFASYYRRLNRHALESSSEAAESYQNCIYLGDGSGAGALSPALREQCMSVFQREYRAELETGRYAVMPIPLLKQCVADRIARESGQLEVDLKKVSGLNSDWKFIENKDGKVAFFKDDFAPRTALNSASITNNPSLLHRWYGSRMRKIYELSRKNDQKETAIQLGIRLKQVWNTYKFGNLVEGFSQMAEDLNDPYASILADVQGIQVGTLGADWGDRANQRLITGLYATAVHRGGRLAASPYQMQVAVSGRPLTGVSNGQHVSFGAPLQSSKFGSLRDRSLGNIASSVYDTTNEINVSQSNYFALNTQFMKASLDSVAAGRDYNATQMAANANFNGGKGLYGSMPIFKDFAVQVTAQPNDRDRMNFMQGLILHIVTQDFDVELTEPMFEISSSLGKVPLNAEVDDLLTSFYDSAVDGSVFARSTFRGDPWLYLFQGSGELASCNSLAEALEDN